MKKVTKRVIILLLAVVGMLSLALLGGCQNLPNGSFSGIGSGGFNGSLNSDGGGTSGGSIDLPIDPIVPVVPACEHVNTKDFGISFEGCERTYLVICTDCGAVTDSKTVAEHTWSESPVALARKNCAIPERTAIVCVVCGVEKEDTVTFIGEVKEHRSAEITYLSDEDHLDDACVCESETVRAKVCTYCAERLEVIEVIPAPGHVFGDWAVSIDPTATAAGAIARKCTVCKNKHIDSEDSSVYRVIPALYDLDEYGNATTCINSSYTYRRGESFSCSKDGRTDEYSFVAPDGKTLTIEVTVKTAHYLIVDGVITEVDTSKVQSTADYGGQLKWLDDETCDTIGDGYFKCVECENYLKVRIRSEHVAYDEKIDAVSNLIAPTCTMAGFLTYKCRNCCREVEVTLAALGHDFVFTVSGSKAESDLTVAYECVRDDCSESGTLSDVVDVEIITKPTCMAYGSAVIKFKDGEERTVTLDKTYCTLNGELMVCDYKHPYSPNKAGVQFIGSENNIICKTFTSEDEPNGFFKCDICGKMAVIYVKKDHVWKYAEIGNKAATCEESGHVDATCKNCGKVDNRNIDPLGHDVVATVEDDKVKLSCKREGCKANSVEIDLPATSGVLTSEKGQLIIGESDNYTAELVSGAAATCIVAATYKFVLKPTAFKDLLTKKLGAEKAEAWFDKDIVISFNKSMQADHDGHSVITWTADGWRYTGRYCEACGNVVIIDKQRV